MKPLLPPPPDRDNWPLLNRGQKLYAIREYNKARARRNLPPYVLGEEPVVPPPERPPSEASTVDFNERPISPANSVNSEASTVDLDINRPSTSRDPTTLYQPSTSMSNNVGSTTTGVPTAGDSSGGPPTKKRALPGTGENASDADTGNPSLENAVLPRAISQSGGHTMVFRKNHSFVSYGVASVQLALGSNTSQRVGTTSLMYLPVDKPYFYLSYSEYKNIVHKIMGLRVTEVRVKVCLRNPRTAFETNSSTSNLATLNQNKFINSAVGLNIKTRGLNCLYKFETATKPMVPTSVTRDVAAITNKAISAMYGCKESAFNEVNDAVGATLPCSYLNLPMQFPLYYTMVRNAKHASTIGWPIINNMVEKVDASNLIGSTIVQYSYKPNCGLLTAPWNSVYNGITDSKDKTPKNVGILNMQSGKYFGYSVVDVTANSVGKQTAGAIKELNSDTFSTIFPNDSRYTRPIDCSQFITIGIQSTHDYHVQPSLHVGVCPVHQLTTTSASLVPDKFTDVEATFDIQTEMHCSFDIPYHYTNFDQAHINMEKAYYYHPDATTGIVQNEYISTINGQYAAEVGTT